MTESSILIVHLADLHFGDPGYPLQGSHDRLLLHGLTQAIRLVPRTLGLPARTPTHVTVAGDLTSRGNPLAHDAAMAFLTGRFQPGRSQPRIGLGLSYAEDGPCRSCRATTTIGRA